MERERALLDPLLFSLRFDGTLLDNFFLSFVSAGKKEEKREERKKGKKAEKMGRKNLSETLPL